MQSFPHTCKAPVSSINLVSYLQANYKNEKKSSVEMNYSLRNTVLLPYVSRAVKKIVTVLVVRSLFAFYLIKHKARWYLSRFRENVIIHSNISSGPFWPRTGCLNISWRLCTASLSNRNGQKRKGIWYTWCFTMPVCWLKLRKWSTI